MAERRDGTLDSGQQTLTALVPGRTCFRGVRPQASRTTRVANPFRTSVCAGSGREMAPPPSNSAAIGPVRGAASFWPTFREFFPMSQCVPWSRQARGVWRFWSTILVFSNSWRLGLEKGTGSAADAAENRGNTRRQAAVPVPFPGRVLAWRRPAPALGKPALYSHV
jgi:hypothetical protein